MKLVEPGDAPILCFGEMLLRLSASGGVPLSQARRFEAEIGGAEANVAAALAQLGHQVRMATVLPDSPLGDQAISALRRHGVDTSNVIRGPGRIGLYFLEPGSGPRPSRIVYDRDQSLFTTRAGEFDWMSLTRGIGWLHLSGISVALGEAAAGAVQTAVSAARANGAIVSFDCNYRPSLWQGREAQAPGILMPIMREADIIFGNHRDIALLTGRELGGASEGERRAAAELAFETFPSLRGLISTMRSIEGRAHELAARIDTAEQGQEVTAVRIDSTVDRIGSGDAFVAGVIDGVRRGLDPARMLERGLAAAALKHSIAGDQWIGRSSDLDDFHRLGGSDVQR